MAEVEELIKINFGWEIDKLYRTRKNTWAMFCSYEQEYTQSGILKPTLKWFDTIDAFKFYTDLNGMFLRADSKHFPAGFGGYYDVMKEETNKMEWVVDEKYEDNNGTVYELIAVRKEKLVFTKFHKDGRPYCEEVVVRDLFGMHPNPAFAALSIIKKHEPPPRWVAIFIDKDLKMHVLETTDTNAFVANGELTRVTNWSKIPS